MRIFNLLKKLTGIVISLDKGLKFETIPVTLNTSAGSDVINNSRYYPGLGLAQISIRVTRKVTTVVGKQEITVATVPSEYAPVNFKTPLSAYATWNAKDYSYRGTCVTTEGEIILAQYNASNPDYWYISGVYFAQRGYEPMDIKSGGGIK